MKPVEVETVVFPADLPAEKNEEKSDEKSQETGISEQDFLRREDDKKSKEITASPEVIEPDVASQGMRSDDMPLISTHVEARGLALAILSTVALVYALQWAQKFFIPLLFGIFISYTLNPIVVWMERLKIPRVLGTSLLLLSLLGGVVGVCNALQGEFQSILDGLPESTHKISRVLGPIQNGQPSAIEKMQQAASEIEKATSQRTDDKKNSKKVMVDQPRFKVSEWVWAGSMSVVGFFSEATMVVFLVFFLLVSGDTFKRKLVKITGPSISKKKITVHILSDINTTIQNYMFMLFATNTILALLMWIGLRTVGLQNAGAWAIVAGFLHLVPYVGPLLITLLTGLSGLVQFESLSMALLVAGISLLVATIVGTFVTTWMTGRIAKMNAAAVFISLLFWGWLWGIWGLLLGVPVVVIIKVISERVEGMEPIAELLGE